jgi:predicted phage terminase large subunit-like protein
MTSDIDDVVVKPKVKRLKREQIPVYTEQELLDFAIKDPTKLQREINDRSLFEFLLWVWPAYSSQPFVANWHIKYLCKQLEKIAYGVGNRQIKKHDLLINISPGTTKTALCSIIFPVWCWTKWYWMRFITCSYSSDLSLESAEYSRDIVKSALFRSVYPELSIKTDKDSKGNFKIVKLVDNVTRNSKKVKAELIGGNRYSTSVGGTLTGFHADIIIWDDPLKPDEAASPKTLKTVNNWIDQTLPTRKTNKAVSAIIGIMQRLNQNDPSGHLLEKKKKKLKHVCLPGEIIHFKQFVKPAKLVKYYTKDGLFDKERMNKDVLEELESDLGQYGYAGQIGQNPAPPGGGLFKVDNFTMTAQLIDRRQIVKSVRYWDKAATTEAGAYTVGVKMHLLANKFFLIEDVKRGQWSSEVRERMIRQTAIADGTNVDIVIEQEGGSGGKESAEGTIRNLAGFRVKAERPMGDKFKRADPFSVQVNNGSVILVVADWNARFKEEYELFPNGTYKDQVDAGSGAFQFLVKKKKAKRVT